MEPKIDNADRWYYQVGNESGLESTKFVRDIWEEKKMNFAEAIGELRAKIVQSENTIQDWEEMVDLRLKRWGEAIAGMEKAKARTKELQAAIRVLERQ